MPTVYHRETYGISFSRIVTIRATSSTLFVCLGFVEVTRVCGEPCDVGSCVRTPTIPYGITIDINHTLSFDGLSPYIGL